MGEFTHEHKNIFGFWKTWQLGYSSAIVVSIVAAIKVGPVAIVVVVAIVGESIGAAVAVVEIVVEVRICFGLRSRLSLSIR